MDFSKKLDFLMNITKTTNSALSLCTSLDASHISRLRRGERKLVREANYIKTMAAYFARQCVEEYQKKALLETLGKSFDILEDHGKTTEQIYCWLLDSDSQKMESIEIFLGNLSKINKKTSPHYEETLQLKNLGSSEVTLHYGYEGKKNAVIGFLSCILESNKTDTLLLYSDELMEWMTEDPPFISKWAEMLKQLIIKGNRIRIIHTLNRNLDEMLEAMTKWMPIYMTGAVEPYYYPKKRDGIFKRTMFIFPETVVMTATSIDSMADMAVNILLRNSKAAEAYLQEFNAYLRLCKPLMRIFTPREEAQYLSILEEFEKEEANAIVEANYLSVATIPVAVAESMFERINRTDKDDLMNYYHKRKDVFIRNLTNNSYIEVICLPEIDEIRKGDVELGFTGIADFEGLFYTSQEYLKHLINIIQLLETYDNYNLILKKRISNTDYTLYSKEDLGVFVFKTNKPNLIFTINESNMNAAFWDFLNANIVNVQENNKHKSETIEQLQAIIQELETNDTKVKSE